MISVDKLNEHLIGNFDAIVEILERLELTNISINRAKDEIRCSREEGRNPSSICIKANTLFYKCFSTGEKGNIYCLIMNRTEMNFRDTLKWVAKLLGLESSSLQATKIKRLPFGGFYKNIIKQMEEPELNMQTYDESILDEYRRKYNILFNRDGIGYTSQEKFDVGYDIISNRITIPQWDVNGNLVGIMGRLNDPDADKDRRWLPLISCHRNYTLFGFHQNYQTIQNKRTAFVGESEKFVMQLHSMGYNNALAVCGCDISRVQAKYIKSLMCGRIVLCLDEGLDEEMVREQAKKIKLDNPILTNEVGYVYDRDGEVMTKGSKVSPADLGAEKLKVLVKEHTVWL